MPKESGRVRIGEKWLNSEGAWVYKTHGSGVGRSGVPDHVGCIDGLFFGIEWKVEGGKVSDLQKRELRRIRHAGGMGVVVYSVDEMKHFIRELQLGVNPTTIGADEGRQA